MKQTNENHNLKDISGKETGLWKDYYSNGNLYCEGNYESGKVFGFWKYYDDSGELTEIIYYS
jgi:antitoxin component YwqK of YwqJK toxin-antitoxin module